MTDPHMDVRDAEIPAATAKAVRFHRTGPAEVLQLDDLPVPQPGAEMVRLRVKALGLNRAEILFREGRYFETPSLPSRNGYEAAGIIDAVGPGVDTSWIGKAVSTIPGTFGLNQHGVYGEVAVVPVGGVAEYPPALSFEQAASVWMQYLTAYGALIHLAGIRRGDAVVITAASSSVGIAAVETVKAEGGTSIAVTRTAAKKADLFRHGADHVVVTTEENLAERIKAITAGQGANVVFDAVGGGQLEALAEASAYAGRIVLYGGLASEPTPFPLWPSIGKNLTFSGFGLAGFVSTGELATATRYIYERLASGAFRPVIARTFPLSRIVEAHRFMESGEQIGKIVVTV